MREKQNNWQRIEAVIKWANMSTNYFARHIGLARGENLYQIKRGNNGISLDVADRIVSKFPQVDKLWLLTGEGQMFADEKLRGARYLFIMWMPNRPSRTSPTSRPRAAWSSLRRASATLPCVTWDVPWGTPAAGAVVLLKAVDRDAIIPGENM